MPTLREYFTSESNTYFAQIADQVNRFETSRGEPQELLRITRALRGSAHLAREDRVYRAAMALEAAARGLVNGTLDWGPDIGESARETISDLRALAAGESDEDADARVMRVIERWLAIGAQIPSEGGAVDGERSTANRQFREFAAHEVSGIVSELESGLAQFPADPRNRDALKTILRRQRALLGAARLDEITVVAETLRAIEDLVRLIVKLNVAVKDEWAAVFKAARDVLAGAVDPLRQGVDPAATPALSTLRTLRTELLERFGEDAVAAAPPSAASTAAAEAPPAPPPPAASPAPNELPAPSVPAVAAVVATAAPEEEIVGIEQLCYSGEPALRRALELRGQLETLAGEDSDARAAVEEVFDLIRLGIG